jgi:hypothetical protein
MGCYIADDGSDFRLQQSKRMNRKRTQCNQQSCTRRIRNRGNMVKSEAPDAVTKIVQGYGLPKLMTGRLNRPSILFLIARLKTAVSSQ